MFDPLLGDPRERAEHALTLRRTAVAIGWAAGLLIVLILGTVVLTERSGAGGTFALLMVSLLCAGVVAGGPVLVLALWLLRRLPRGRAPRILVGGLAGLAVGVVEVLIFGGTSPWAFAHDEPAFAVMVLLWPLVAGAAAGAIVGPRPTAEVPGAGPDERAEDALLGGAD